MIDIFCFFPVEGAPVTQWDKHCSAGLDRWMADLKFYVPFNSISVISGRWGDDNERLCAMEE